MAILSRVNVGILAAAAVAWLAFPGVGVTVAGAAPETSLSGASLEALEYSEDLNVPIEQAEIALAVQAKGNEADIAGQMQDRLGAAFAGIWFDNRTQEFVVPVLGPQSAWLAEGELRATGLRAGDFRLAPAKLSWSELEVTQVRLNRALSRPSAAGLALTSIDPRTNAVVIEVAKGAGPAVAAEVRQAHAQSGGRSEIRYSESQGLLPRPTACQEFNCDLPYRAGVGISKADEFGESDCTGAFKATGIGTGDRYVLSAGHCAVNTTGTKWEAYNSNGKPLELGVTERAYWGTSGYDLVKINATGSEWDAESWPVRVTEWDPKTLTITNPAQPITSEAHSYLGQYACHTGIATGTSCGFVQEMGVGYEIKYPDRHVIVKNLVALDGVCMESGDSGGPVFAGGVALGITSAEDGELAHKICENTDFYTQITEASDVFGVTVAPRPTSWHYDNTPGGTLTSKPAVSSSESDRLDLFAKGTNNALWYRHWNGSGWNPWQDLGGQMSSGPSATSWGPGRIDVVFLAANGSVEHWYWSNNQWKADNLGGEFAFDPAVTSWGPGRLDVFARGKASRKLWHKWWTTTHGWSAWEDMGGDLASGPAAASWGPGRIDVAAVKTSDSSLQHWYWDGSSWKTDNLGGSFASEPALATWGPNRLDVFARGKSSNKLWHKWWANPGGYSAWEDMGGALTSGVSAVSWFENRIDVVGRAADNSTAHWWWGS